MQRFPRPHHDQGSSNLRELLLRIPLFSELSPEQSAQVAGNTLRRQLDKGQFLFRHGDCPKHLFAVIYGQVKLSIPAPDGHEKVVNIAGPKQIFGEAAMFLDKPSQLDAEVIEESLVLCVGKDAVVALIQGDTRFAERFCEALCTRVLFLVKEIGTCSLKNASRRVIDYLLEHCPEDLPRTSLEITLPVTKQIIASQLNLTPESLSRILHDLAAAKILKVDGRHILITDVDGLRMYCH